MHEKLRRAGRRSRYRLRKQIVEPVFGQIKAAMRFTGFLLRGLRKVRSEWRLVAAAHNPLLAELYGGGLSLGDAPMGGLRARLRLPLAD